MPIETREKGTTAATIAALVPPTSGAYIYVVKATRLGGQMLCPPNTSFAGQKSLAIRVVSNLITHDNRARYRLLQHSSGAFYPGSAWRTPFAADIPSKRY